MKVFLYLCGLAGLFVLPQCTKDNNAPITDIGSASYFPDKVGYRWAYKVTDSLKNVTNIVTVTITGTFNDPKTGKTLKIWQYKWPDRVVNTYEERNGDTIRFFEDWSADYTGIQPPLPSAEWTGHHWTEINIYIVPFSPNQSISYPSKDVGFGASSTDDSMTYNDLNGKQQISSVYYIQRGGTAVPNDYLEWYEYYAPHVGMVYQHFYKYGFGQNVQAWKLLYNDFSASSIKWATN